MEISDNKIVEQVVKGDTEAYAELVQRYQKIIYNLMFRISSSSDDAAELTQEVFFTAYKKLGSFRSEKNFFPWLYTLAMNRGRDWRRKNTKEWQGLQKYSGEIFDLATPAATDKIEKRQEIEKLAGALVTLPSDTREMVLLRYKHEVSIKELSEIFSLSQSGIKMRIHRALQTLHDSLKNQ